MVKDMQFEEQQLRTERKIKELEEALTQAVGDEAPKGASLRSLLWAAGSDERTEKALLAAIRMVKADFRAEMSRED